jgi:hypothetical protein
VKLALVILVANFALKIQNAEAVATCEDGICDAKNERRKTKYLEL